MAEEQRCQEGLRLCANNCGFFGSPATLNLCSKCYHDLRITEEQASSAKVAVEKSLLSTSSSSSPSLSPSITTPVILPEPSGGVRSPSISTVKEGSASHQPRRCLACKKRVGLTGFRCRCGATYCGTHRYPEQHACTFDFKAAGRGAIARANPVVKAEKLDKI